VPYANLTRDEAAARAASVSDVAYAVELDLTGDGRVFASRTAVSFTARPGGSTFVDLQARKVRTAVLNGRDLPADAISDTRIVLDDLEERNELVVEADCEYQRSGVGLHRFEDPVDGNVYLHTQFEPFDANRVYACFDQPDLKAPFTLTVHAPEEWEVLSNTRPVEAGGGTWRFAESLPISPYITALVAGPLHAVHDVWRSSDGTQEVPLGLYCRHSLAQYLDAEEFFEITKQGLDYFTEAFGIAYPFGPYDQVLVPEFNWGAMENPGCVTFSESYVFRSKVTEAAREDRASTILHEMAHMWFGDLVTMRWWDDLWLNESFATYMGTRALAEATRFSQAWASFQATIKAWAVAQDQLPSTHPIAADIVDTEAVRTHFDGITYAKGASVLQQLVAWVGDEAFFSGIKDYFQRHAYGNATLADFLAALERPSGRDLGPWSKQWLETSGVATLRPAVSEADGVISSLELLQEAPGDHPHLRDHRLAVSCYRDDGRALERAERAELDLHGVSTTVDALAGAERPPLLIANDGDLAYVKLRLDDRSLTTLLGGLDRLSDPLARAICWGSAWDMTRDAELEATRFVALVADHARNEHDIALLQNLHRRSQTAADLYCHPAKRSDARGRLADAARSALDASVPGSDAQLVWARAAASTATGTAQLDWVRSLLDGDTAVEGLTIDTDLRWLLLQVLAGHGLADEDRITAEERRDPTDMGARRAAQAHAARPDGDAKAAAWQAVVGTDGLTLAMQRAICAGLWQPGQDDLLRPYLGRYVDAVADAWRERNAEEAIAVTTGLFPRSIVDDSTVAVADEGLARADLPGPAQRIIAEQRDHTLRALAARAFDG
jgi:aminopeptidase N